MDTSADLVPSDRASCGGSGARWRYRAASAAGHTLPKRNNEMSAEWTASIQAERMNLHFKSTFDFPAARHFKVVRADVQLAWHADSTLRGTSSPRRAILTA